MAKESTNESAKEAILHLAGRVEAILAQPNDSRMLIALAGVPGSGKSTVSQALLLELSTRGIHDVAIVPMVRMIMCLYESSQGL
jgi:DNA replication protein DnaC